MGLILVMLMPMVNALDLRHITNNCFGCVYLTEYRQLAQLKAEDGSLFQLMLQRDIEKGYATLFSKTESVYVNQISGKFFQVNRPNHLTSYWTDLYNVAS